MSHKNKPVMEEVNCILCGSSEKKLLHIGHSRQGEPFYINRCLGCSLEYVSPRPDAASIGAYYTADYFTRRDDRGYNDYFSDETAAQINRVLAMNLDDLGFFRFEAEIGKGSVLDIGCAAGYSVKFMADRGWKSTGIDIAPDPVRFGREKGLDLILGSYLETSFDKKFDAVTMWASIEHLHRPDHFIEKVSRDIRPGGMLYLSTCRAGGFGFTRLAGDAWRFYNPPEHLYYFTLGAMKRLLEGYGFTVTARATYGSGFGAPGSLKRKIADWMAKHLLMGDMMILAARRK